MKFRRGSAELAERSGGPFEAGRLPDHEKERLCRSLLAEFGATHVKVGADGELIHGCLLPFGNHKDQDRNPTASLNYLKLTYNCFGCGAGGGLLWFIALCRDQSGEAARKWLASQTTIGADEEALSSLLEYFDSLYDSSQRIEQPMPYMNPKVLDPWLMIHPYMTEDRRIPEETLIRFRVGYGVIKVRGRGGGSVDSHRIVIPHFWKGILVGWQSRRLVDDGTPKYLATPNFPKDRTLFNHRPEERSAVIAESPMSVLSKAHLGTIEATFGAAVTDRQVRLISIHPRVVLFMDNDEAGWTATKRLGDALERYSAVWVANNPYNADPADLDDDTYREVVDDAIPYALWNRPGTLQEWDRDGTS